MTRSDITHVTFPLDIKHVVESMQERGFDVRIAEAHALFADAPLDTWVIAVIADDARRVRASLPKSMQCYLEPALLRYAAGAETMVVFPKLCGTKATLH